MISTIAMLVSGTAVLIASLILATNAMVRWWDGDTKGQRK